MGDAIGQVLSLAVGVALSPIPIHRRGVDAGIRRGPPPTGVGPYLAGKAPQGSPNVLLGGVTGPSDQGLDPGVAGRERAVGEGSCCQRVQPHDATYDSYGGQQFVAQRREIMELQKRQFLRLGKRPMAFVVVAFLASLMLAWAGPAQAKRIRGTKGPDRIVGTAKADVIKALGGNDRVKGRGARDRLFGGREGRRRSLERRRRPAGPCRQWRTGQGRLQGRRDRSGQDEGLRDREDRKGAAVPAAVPAAVLEPARAASAPRRTPGSRPAACGGLRKATRRRRSAIRSTRSRSPSTASADGLTGDELPISIEEVCDVPERLAERGRPTHRRRRGSAHQLRRRRCSTPEGSS